MIVSLIVAMDRRGLIGDEKGIPWHLPKDLLWFKDRTMGKPIVMGRRTFQLIGKPLPGRDNIILTRDRSFSAFECKVGHSVKEVLSLAKDSLARLGGDEVMIVGGGEVYSEFIAQCDRIYMTVVDGVFSGTVYFPKDKLLSQSWRVAYEEKKPSDERNPYAHWFYLVERIRTNRAKPNLANTVESLSGMSGLFEIVRS